MKNCFKLVCYARITCPKVSVGKQLKAVTARLSSPCAVQEVSQYT